MPYLQLDVCDAYPADVKRQLAKRFGEIFADIMQTTPKMVTVAIREIGEGGIWRCGEGDPEPAAVLMCDVRRGRPADQRARLADALVGECAKLLNLNPDHLAVDFTQHAGDEMYKAEQGGLGRDWSSDEALEK